MSILGDSVGVQGLCVCRVVEGREMFSLFWSLNCLFANGNIFLFQSETMGEVMF